MARSDPTTARIVDLSDQHWHIRTRQGLPFEVQWNNGRTPPHHFRTREAAEAAIAEVSA